MGNLDKNSEAYRSKEYPELFEASQLNKMLNDDYVAYSQSYQKMQEMQSAIDYNARISYNEVKAEGKAESIIEVALRMIKGGFSNPEINAITELSYQEIDSLRRGGQG